MTSNMVKSFKTKTEKKYKKILEAAAQSGGPNKRGVDLSFAVCKECDELFGPKQFSIVPPMDILAGASSGFTVNL